MDTLVSREPLDAARMVFAFLIPVVWAAVVVMSLVTHATIDPWVHMLAGAVATGLFGPAIWKRNGRNGNAA